MEIVQGERTLRAPLVFVSPGQIDAQLPYEITVPTMVFTFSGAP